MNFIKLYRRGEGCEMPKGKNHLMITAYGVDEHGNWFPSHEQSFKTWKELGNELRGITASGGRTVVRASGHFRRLTRKLGLKPLASEWGTRQ